MEEVRAAALDDSAHQTPSTPHSSSTTTRHSTFACVHNGAPLSGYVLRLAGDKCVYVWAGSAHLRSATLTMALSADEARIHFSKVLQLPNDHTSRSGGANAPPLRAFTERLARNFPGRQVGGMWERLRGTKSGAAEDFACVLSAKIDSSSVNKKSFLQLVPRNFVTAKNVFCLPLAIAR